MPKHLNVALVLAGALVELGGAAAAQEQVTAAVIEEVPQAGRLFDGLKDQFTIVLPEGWTVYDQTAAVTGKPSPYGMVFFSAEPMLAPGERVLNPDTPEAFLRVDRGDVPSFFVDRHPAGKGMSCARLTRGARSQIDLMVGNDSVFGGLARQMLLPRRPQTSEIELAGCQGLRLEGRGKGWNLDVRAVSDGKTLYLFSLRNTSDNFVRNLGTYEAALATLRLSSEPAGARNTP